MDRNPRPSLDLLLGKKDLVGAEIGVQTGVNAQWMLNNLDLKKLYLVDPYKEYRCNNKKPVDEGGMHPNTPEIKKNCKKLLKKWENKIEYFYEFSWDALCKFEPQSLDFVYIDGDHRKESVLRDLGYISKIKLGGLLCGHDWRFKSVKSALNEFVKEKAVPINCCGSTQYVCPVKIESAQSDWWIKLPDVGDMWFIKCRYCQRVHSVDTNNISWLQK